MANSVNGRIHLTANVAAGSESAYTKLLKEAAEAIEKALEGIEIKGVTIDAARVDFVRSVELIEGASSDDSDDDEDEDEDEDGDE